MAISFNCPSCDKSYKANDDAAGKTFHCRKCDLAFSIPNRVVEAEDDPWNVAEGPCAPPPVTRRRKPAETFVKVKSKVRRQDVRPGIPVTVVFALLIEGLLISFNGFNLLMSLLRQGANALGLAGLIFRILLEIAIVVGLWQGRHLARMATLILSGLGLVLAVVCGGGAALLADQQRIAADFGGRGILLGLILMQAVLFIAQIVLLLTDSAANYCDR